MPFRQRSGYTGISFDAQTAAESLPADCIIIICAAVIKNVKQTETKVKSKMKRRRGEMDAPRFL